MHLKHKHVGIIVLGFAVVFFFVLLVATIQIKDLNVFLHKDCPLPEDICPANKVLPTVSVIGFTVDALLAIFGIMLFLEKNVATKPAAKKMPQGLDTDEEKIYKLIVAHGALFQRDIVESSGYSKVKVSRILDRLEGRGLIEKRRRGMANMIVIKE